MMSDKRRIKELEKRNANQAATIRKWGVDLIARECELATTQEKIVQRFKWTFGRRLKFLITGR